MLSIEYIYMIPFNYHHLYYFYIIAKEGSVSKAAKTLRLAQPTLSAQLKQFESFLDKKLFERENRELRLTEDGHRILGYAKSIFDLGQELMDQMGDLSQKGRIQIQIGLSNFIPKSFADLLLNFILKVEPAVQITLIEDRIETLLVQLEDHLLDIVFHDSTVLPVTAKSAEHRLIADIPVIFCANTKLAEKLGKFPGCLNEASLILPTAPSQVAFAVREFLLSKKLNPRILGEIQDIEIVRRLTLRGHGIAPLNLLTISHAPAKEDLKILHAPGNSPISEKIYALTRPRKNPHPLVSQILSEFKVEPWLKK